MTSGTEGGIRMPRVPPAASVPVAKPPGITVPPHLGKRHRGDRRRGRDRPDPQIAAKAPQPPIVASANPPRRWPSQALQARYSASLSLASPAMITHQDEHRDDRQVVRHGGVVGGLARAARARPARRSAAACRRMPTVPSRNRSACRPPAAGTCKHEDQQREQRCRFHRRAAAAIRYSGAPKSAPAPADGRR